MRIQPTIFRLDIQLKHYECNGRLNLSAFYRNGTPIDIVRKERDDIETISLQVQLPSNILLVLSGKNYKTDIEFDHQGKRIKDKAIEMLGMSLAGIRFNYKKIQKLAIFSPDTSTLESRPFNEYQNLDSIESLNWDRNGYVTLNLFDCNPFLYHLNVGTKIQF
jgi:hypothetical protein